MVFFQNSFVSVPIELLGMAVGEEHAYLSAAGSKSPDHFLSYSIFMLPV